MDIDRRQIKYKKEIGTVGKDSVMEIGTIGGLYLIVLAKNGKIETMGVGPHRAVARHIAKKRYADFKLTDLNKADELPESAYISKVPEYEALTDKFKSFNK